MENTSICFIVVLLLCLILNTQTHAQARESYENTVFGSYGTIVFSTQGSVSYERLLAQKDNLKTRAKLNGGIYFGNHADYDETAKVYWNFASVSAVQTFGIFELNAGIAYVTFNRGGNTSPATERRGGIDFYGNAALRFEKDWFVGRIGVGNLELLHLSLGLNF